MSSVHPPPIRIGLAGAGPWARLVHGPLFAAGPQTALAGVWSRTPTSAAALADTLGTTAVATYDALLEQCDAVVLCVPPSAQPELAIAAAQRGRPMLLEKPIALDAHAGAPAVDAIEASGVANLAMLTNRFSEPVREFLAAARDFDVVGARACFLSSAFLGGPFATSEWRHEYGALLDVGPHIFDLVEAAVGPVAAVLARRSSGDFVTVQFHHERGVSSSIDICCSTAGESRTEVELFGRQHRLALDARRGDPELTMATVRAEFAAIARTGGVHEASARRLLDVHTLIDAAYRSLATGRPEQPAPMAGRQ